eukprot:scaffold38558_cov55-Cyclotella_meneghiniana.AAC.7
MKLTFAFVAAVVSSAYIAPVVASKASDVVVFSEIVKDIHDKIHLDKKDVTEKPNLRGGQDGGTMTDVGDCFPAGHDFTEDYMAYDGPDEGFANDICVLCCSKKCVKWGVSAFTKSGHYDGVVCDST